VRGHGATRRLLVIIAVCGAALLPAATAPAMAATLDYQAFTPQAPRFHSKSAKGTLDNQINYRASGGPRTQWSFRLSPLLVLLAKGPATEIGTLYCNGKHVGGSRDFHTGVSAGYLFHSSYGPLRTSCKYRLNVTIAYNIAGGTATIVINHGFYITYA
jgi:hypothetical protein